MQKILEHSVLVIDIQFFVVASQKAAVGDVVGFSGLLPRGLRAPRTGRAEMSSRKSGAERGKVGFFFTPHKFTSSSCSAGVT